MKPVIFEYHQTSHNKFISVIKLNSPGSLNALTLEMVDLLQEHLDSIRYNEDVVAVVLDSVIEKAFCAGGDVVSITQAVKKGDHQFAADFFSREYKLDRDIHRFPKPVICIANGIIMGGGMGLMNGCSHRIVTDTTYMAMPEISIGLFPDVGGSWFLNQVPGNLGLFLGLTAAPMNAADARYLGLADYTISHELKATVIENLCNADWHESAHQVVSDILNSLETLSLDQCSHIQSKLKEYETLLEEQLNHDSLVTIAQSILALPTEDRWLKKAQDNLKYGSPLSAFLIHQQLLRTKNMSLEEVFKFEYNLVTACCKQGDFCEGVRALLIDKDRQPAWKYTDFTEVDPGFVESFFE